MTAVGATVDVRTVLGVARLGEADLRGWWSCHGLDRAGSFVLQRAFPRTALAAGLELDLLSARRRHEDALAGRASALHLFSDVLPFRRQASAWLSEQKTAAVPDPLLAELADWDLSSAEASLRGHGGVVEAPQVLADGLRLGEVRRSDLDSDTQLSSVACCLAAAYAELGDTFRAPYFDLTG